MTQQLTLVSHLLCPSVRNAVVPEYPQHLRAFLQQHQAHLLTLA